MNNLDETRLNTGRPIECHQNSTSTATGSIALFTQNTHTSSPSYVTRRRPTSTVTMTSYSSLKRKAQRADISSNVSRT